MASIACVCALLLAMVAVASGAAASRPRCRKGYQYHHREGRCKGISRLRRRVARGFARSLDGELERDFRVVVELEVWRLDLIYSFPLCRRKRMHPESLRTQVHELSRWLLVFLLRWLLPRCRPKDVQRLRRNATALFSLSLKSRFPSLVFVLVLLIKRFVSFRHRWM